MIAIAKKYSQCSLFIRIKLIYNQLTFITLEIYTTF